MIRPFDCNMKIFNFGIGILLFFPLLTWAAGPDTAEWVRQENLKTRAFLANSSLLQKKIQARAAELAPKNPPVRGNYQGVEFFIKAGSLFIKGLSAQSDRLVVDVSNLPTGSAVTEYRPSPNLKMLAYGTAIYGTDWTTWRILDLTTLTEIAGPFSIKSGGVDEINWDLDSSGFFYQGWVDVHSDLRGQRKPQIIHHALNSPQKSDTVVFEDQESPHTIRYNSLPAGPDQLIVYRVLGGAEVPLSAYVVQGFKSGSLSRRELVKPGQFWGRFVGTAHGAALFRTSEVGNRYGILSVDLQSLEKKVLVPESSSEVLIQAQQIGNRLVLQYFDKNLNNLIRVTDLNGQLLKTFYPQDLGLPSFGSFSLLTGNYSSKASYLTYQSITLPTQTLRFDIDSLTFALMEAGAIHFDGSRISRRIVQFPSHDGRSIPMDIFVRNDSASEPKFVYLLSYGNIGIANLPQYNRKFQLILELGGAVALPHVRGGGEYGLGWQKEGIFNKKNMLEDVRFASRFLKSYFPSIGERVVLSGRSYGGMMTMSQYVLHPEDFDLFIPVVGVSDPIGFLTSEQGWWAADDFGLERDVNGNINFGRIDEMRTWSPLENIPRMTVSKPLMAFSQQYDTRVGSMQTIQFIQALRVHLGDSAPIHMLELENGGHAAKAELVEELTFIANQYGLEKINPIERIFSRPTISLSRLPL